MASVVIAGDVSGTCTLQAANAAGTTVLSLPTTSGTLVATNGSPTFVTVTSTTDNTTTLNATTGNITTGNITTVTAGLGNATAPSITFTGDTNTGIFSPTADTIAFTEGGTEAMRLTSAGDVGIGTTSPGCKLEVGGLIRATSLTNPSSGSGVEIGYDGTQGVIQAFSNRATNTAAPINIQGDLKMNSGYGSSAIAYGCRAWVNFNGTGTVAIRASGNVSSITDNGTGDYTINFSTALADANYAYTLGTTTPDLSGCNVNILARGTQTSITTKTTTALRINTGPTTFNAYYDMFDCNVVIHR